MLSQGIIRRSMCPQSLPFCVVPKKISIYHNISDLNQLGKHTYFLHQISLSNAIKLRLISKIQPKLLSHYEFVRMQSALKNALFTFHRVMNTILLGIQNEYCFVYMDDIIISSPINHEHIIRKRTTNVLQGVDNYLVFSYRGSSINRSYK